MIRRTHPSPERSFEHRQDFGIQASIGTLLQSIEDLRAELSQSQARLRSEQTRTSITHCKLERAERQNKRLRDALHQATQPRRRRRKVINDQQITINLEGTKS